MFEKGIRGGITQAIRHYAKANNKYMGELYKHDDERSYLQYLDANNLYGWAMSEALPIHGFKWVKNVEEFTAKTITKLAKKNKHGYLLEVDVDYPGELHEKHNELTFLPEKMEIDKVMKLVPNLFNKKQYVVYIRALSQALNHGLILKKVHSAWLKSYIEMNTSKVKKRRNKRIRKRLF